MGETLSNSSQQPTTPERKPSLKDIDRMTPRQYWLYVLGAITAASLHNPVTPVNPTDMLARARRERADPEERAVIQLEINAFTSRWKLPTQPGK